MINNSIRNKIKNLEKKLNPFVYKKYFESHLEELTKLDNLGLLKNRKNNLARVLSTIKNLNLSHEDVSLFEIGSGPRDNVKFWECKEDYHNSNVFNFFIKNNSFIEYHGFDSLVSEDNLERISEEYSFFEEINVLKNNLFLILKI